MLQRSLLLRHDYNSLPPQYTVFSFQSAMSISGVPAITHSSSWGSKVPIYARGIISRNPLTRLSVCWLVPRERRQVTIRSTYSCLFVSSTLMQEPPGFSSYSEICVYMCVCAGGGGGGICGEMSVCVCVSARQNYEVQLTSPNVCSRTVKLRSSGSGSFSRTYLRLL